MGGILMALVAPKDRRGKMNRVRTNSLFIETIDDHIKYEPLFNLSQEDDVEKNGKVYPSLKKIYLDIGDPTEYEFAVHVFGEWKIWKRVSANKDIKRYVDDWREELEVKIRSDAIRSLRDAAQTEGTRGIAAAKYVAERGWEKVRGSRTKEASEQRTKIEKRISSVIDEDAERLGIH